MKNLINGLALSLLVTVFVMGATFGADTNYQGTRVAGKYKRTIQLALGSAVTTTLTGTTSITLNVDATTGRGELPQIMTLQNLGVTSSVIDVIGVTNMAIGDVVILQTYQATEDVFVKDDNSTILLPVASGASVTLNDPSDELWLRKVDSTTLKCVGYFDNK